MKGFQSVEGSPGQAQHASGGVVGALSVFLEDQSCCLPNALGRLGSAEASGWKSASSYSSPLTSASLVELWLHKYRKVGLERQLAPCLRALQLLQWTQVQLLAPTGPLTTFPNCNF